MYQAPRVQWTMAILALSIHVTQPLAQFIPRPPMERVAQMQMFVTDPKLVFPAYVPQVRFLRLMMAIPVRPIRAIPRWELSTLLEHAAAPQDT